MRWNEVERIESYVATNNECNANNFAFWTLIILPYYNYYSFRNKYEWVEHNLQGIRKGFFNMIMSSRLKQRQMHLWSVNDMKVQRRQQLTFSK